MKVSGFFKKVSHPILTDIQLSFGGIDVYDLYPNELPDIFKGSQLLVLGKYSRSGSSRATLSGSAQGTDRRFRYDVDFRSDPRHDFIPRLWATRRIGYLISELRLHGQNQELVDEVVRLSKKYGVITEYTSFLVDADYRLAAHELAPQATKKFAESSVDMVGAGAVNRAEATKGQMGALQAPRGFMDAEGKEQRVTRMAQIGNRTFFKKDGLWVDSEYQGKIEAIKVKSLSDAYFKLLDQAPEIGRFLALGDEVIFLLQGKAIHVSEDGKTDFTSTELKALLGR